MQSEMVHVTTSRDKRIVDSLDSSCELGLAVIELSQARMKDSYNSQGSLNEKKLILQHAWICFESLKLASIHNEDCELASINYHLLEFSQKQAKSVAEFIQESEKEANLFEMMAKERRRRSSKWDSTFPTIGNPFKKKRAEEEEAVHLPH